MSIIRVYFVFVFISALCGGFFSSGISAAADFKAPMEQGASPHYDTSDCTICHVAPEEKLRGWFVFDSTKREMKSDLNLVCKKCHTLQPNHAGERAP